MGARYLARVTRRLLPLLPALLWACIDPLVEDEVPPQDVIFDFDPAEDEKAWARGELAEQIAEHDGIDGSTVARLSAFSGGQRVWYWDFGSSPTFAAPLWQLVNPFAEGDEIVPIDHPFIWDVVPGDTAYSPYWRVYRVSVTDKYAGERLTSRRAIDEAVRLGLVLPPQPTDLYSNCPVVDDHVRMQVRPGSFPGWEEEPCPDNDDATCIAPQWAYCKGVRIAYFSTNGSRAIDPEGTLPVETVYELRRETESLPLSEPVRGVDITGDADAVDTNDVFETTPCDAAYTPVHRTTEVFVAATYSSIDTASDETQADARNVHDLFNANGSPRAAVVRGLEEREVLRNLAVENRAECPGAEGY